ncbi:MAG: hypothetical protein ACEQSX_04270 [Baekduiaceae bacterium]
MNRRERRAAKRQRRRLKVEVAQAAHVAGLAVVAAERMSGAIDEARDLLAQIEELGDAEQIARARRRVAEAEAGLVEHYGHIEGYAASIEGLAR